MALNLEGKKAIVAEVNEVAKTALSAVVADARGVEANDMATLRRELREAGVWTKVVRNTLAKRAVEGTSYELLTDSFVGPTLIAFATDHPGAGARILKDFAKGNDKLEVQVAVFEGEMTPVELLASLPTYDEAIAKLMSVMKEASAGKLARVLAAVRDQKEQEAA